MDKEKKWKEYEKIVFLWLKEDNIYIKSALEELKDIKFKEWCTFIEEEVKEKIKNGK